MVKWPDRIPEGIFRRRDSFYCQKFKECKFSKEDGKGLAYKNSKVITNQKVFVLTSGEATNTTYGYPDSVEAKRTERKRFRMDAQRYVRGGKNNWKRLRI